jgi:hypothetical protein
VTCCTSSASAATCSYQWRNISECNESKDPKYLQRHLQSCHPL